MPARRYHAALDQVVAAQERIVDSLMVEGNSLDDIVHLCAQLDRLYMGRIRLTELVALMQVAEGMNGWED